MSQSNSSTPSLSAVGAAGALPRRPRPLRETLKATSLVDALYEAVRTEILEGRLQSGSLLTEKALSADYDVARPTAKAVLERLTHDGLLRRGNNKTARVPLLNEHDVLDLYRSRGFLEREVARTLAASRHVPIEARQAQQAFQSALNDRSVLSLVQADIDFHCALLNAVESQRLSHMYRMLMGEMRLCMAQVQARQLLSPDMIAHEHDELLAMIEAGDIEAAARTINDHLDSACQQLLGYMADHASHPNAVHSL